MLPAASYPRFQFVIVRLTVVKWLKFPLLPVIFNGKGPPVLANLLTEIVRMDWPGVLTGLTLNFALVLFGNPLTLRLTELDAPVVPSEIVDDPLFPRLIVRDVGEAEIEKSGAGAATVSVTVLEWLRPPLVPVIVIG